MRLNAVNTLICTLMALLMSYGIVSAFSSEYVYTLYLASFFILWVALAGTIAVEFHDVRIGVNVRLLSVAYLLVALSLLITMAWAAAEQTSFFVANGIALLVYLLLASSIYRAPQH
jgi:hypothetical protein